MQLFMTVFVGINLKVFKGSLKLLAHKKKISCLTGNMAQKSVCVHACAYFIFIFYFIIINNNILGNIWVLPVNKESEFGIDRRAKQCMPSQQHAVGRFS